jgi:predicted NBD/HSP70 family sugar kinase
MQRAVRQRRGSLRPPELGGINRGLVLRLLRQYEPISRVEIAHRSGLSEGTTSRIIAQLLEEKLVVEDGAQASRRGRPPTRLHLNREFPLAVGVDVHRWDTRFCVGTPSGRILESRSVRTPASPRKALEMISDWVASYRRRNPSRCLDGIGISARGLLNPETGVIELGQDPSWIGVPVKEWLEERLKLPVFLENSVRAAAAAEHTFGGPEVRDSRCLLFVEAEEGVGFGIVLDGRVFHGPRMAAGEFGQMVIADCPGPERHARPGCLEQLTCYGALCERYRRMAALQSHGEPRPAGPDSGFQVRRICRQAVAGDEPARRAVLETCRYLGIGIANVVWGLDADVVILSGAITDAWPLVAPALRDQFPGGQEFSTFRNLILSPSVLGGKAAVIGAIMLPFDGLFSCGQRVSSDRKTVNRTIKEFPYEQTNQQT